MDATASTAAEVSQRVLADLVEQFHADAAFLRYNDHNIRASKLVAEWPPRPNRPDPDPLELVHFASADPVFAYCAHGKEPIVIQLDPANDIYRAYQGQTAERHRVALGRHRTAGFEGADDRPTRLHQIRGRHGVLAISVRRNGTRLDASVASRPLRLKRGNPTRLPARLPARDCCQFQ